MKHKITYFGLKPKKDLGMPIEEYRLHVKRKANAFGGKLEKRSNVEDMFSKQFVVVSFTDIVEATNFEIFLNNMLLRLNFAADYEVVRR